MKISSPCQGGVEWTISADAGDDQGGNSGYADWLYDVISTSNGNLFAVGFAREDESDPGQHPDVPGYFLMNSNGKLLKDGVIETNGHGPSGRFRDAEENANGYFAAGFRFTDNIKHALLVKINKQTLNPDLIFDFIPPGYLEARFFSVENIENNWLLVTGFALNQ